MSHRGQHLHNVALPSESVLILFSSPKPLKRQQCIGISLKLKASVLQEPANRGLTVLFFVVEGYFHDFHPPVCLLKQPNTFILHSQLEQNENLRILANKTLLVKYVSKYVSE